MSTTKANCRRVVCAVLLFLCLTGAALVSRAQQDKNPFLPFWNTNAHRLQDTAALPNIRPQQLKLLGMAWSDPQKKDLRILVELPDGKSAILRPQTRIGPYQGKITRIEDRSIEVVETCKDILGQPEKRLTVLTLLPSEEDHE